MTEEFDVKQENPENRVEEAPETVSNETDGTNEKEDVVPEAQAQGMSKKQLRREKYKVKWEEKKLYKRGIERQKRKDKRKALAEAGELSKLRKRKDFRKMSQSNSKQRIVIDMSFDDKMIEKDQKKTVQQIGWCYTANRHMQNPFQFHIVAFDGPSRNIYEGNEHSLNQDIHLHREKLEDVFATEDIVYLTSDSDNVLMELDESKVYVIGGIVDHNSEKGLCHRIAQEKGFQHARLPLDEHLLMKTRRVLTINHVYEILVHFSVNADWKAALLSIIPERKNAKAKDSDDVKIEDVEEEEDVKDSEDIGEESGEPKAKRLPSDID